MMTQPENLIAELNNRLDSLCAKTVDTMTLDALHACRPNHPLGRDNDNKWHNALYQVQYAMRGKGGALFDAADVQWLRTMARNERVARGRSQAGSTPSAESVPVADLRSRLLREFTWALAKWKPTMAAEELAQVLVESPACTDLLRAAQCAAEARRQSYAVNAADAQDGSMGWVEDVSLFDAPQPQSR